MTERLLSDNPHLEWPETDLQKMGEKKCEELLNIGLTIPAGDACLFLAKLKMYMCALKMDGKINDEMLGIGHAVVNDYIETVKTAHAKPEDEVLFDAMIGNLLGYSIAACKTPGGIVNVTDEDMVKH